ncbi:hypothetical protein ACFXPI_34470 [Streptomyces sp. NPDC059104]|uniref:hypothetical protein n=1 Tax=Streptomyces sp. NPDC059104 TaxID=3346729 RepID=UPI003685D89D
MGQPLAQCSMVIAHYASRLSPVLAGLSASVTGPVAAGPERRSGHRTDDRHTHRHEG